MKMKGNLLFVLLLLFSSVYAVNLGIIEGKQMVEDDYVNNTATISDLYEISPRFPGGDKALLDFIKNNMHYPELAKEKRLEGRVVVGFYVETDGSITNLSILKSVDSLLDEEALRIAKKMPKWEPGQLGGEIVRMKCSLPVTFRCEDSTNDSTKVLLPIKEH